MGDPLETLAKNDIYPQDGSIPTPIGEVAVRFLEINTSALGSEMQKQAAYYGWVAAAWAAAETEVENLEQQIKERQSYLWGLLRQQKEEGKKLTVADMENEVQDDPEVQELQRELVTAEYSARTLKVLRDALDQKSRLIQSFVGLERSKIDQQLQESRALVGERLSGNNNEEE